jgi:hypothetical protein
MKDSIHEPARDVPVAQECDVCVIGGSTTGVFAAVAAARLGRSVALVEGQGHFGGVATSSLVTVWHTHLDTELKKPIMSYAVHSAQGEGLIFRYLDGREVFVGAAGQSEKRRWRSETPVSPTFYQIPYRSLVPRGSVNVLVAGRAIDADEGAFGAIRVMVNCMQTGQAAGVAAHVALKADRPCAGISVDELRRLLTEQGAIVQPD